jgi:hypothetical protein
MQLNVERVFVNTLFYYKTTLFQDNILGSINVSPIS